MTFASVHTPEWSRYEVLFISLSPQVDARCVQMSLATKAMTMPLWLVAPSQGIGELADQRIGGAPLYNRQGLYQNWWLTLA